MANEAEILVELEQEAPAAVETVVNTTEEGKQPETTDKAVEVADPFQELKKQVDEYRQASEKNLADAARARQEADAARNEIGRLSQEVTKARADTLEGHIAVLDNAIAAAQAEADAAQRDQAEAMREGDFGKASEAFRRMSKAEARIAQFEQGKIDLEARKTETPVERKSPAVETQKPAPAQDQFEQLIANVSPRAQTWLRAHPQFVTDAALNRKANIAHLNAVDKGLIVDSDAYYDFCERELGLKENPKPNGNGNGAERAARPAPLPGAPVSRDGTPSGGQLSPTQVRLSVGEQRAATDGTVVWERDDPKTGAKKGEPVGVKEYARRKMIMQRNGQYDRAYTDQ